MRCFVIKTKRIPQLHLLRRKRKIPAREFFRSFRKKRIVRFSRAGGRFYFISPKKTAAVLSVIIAGGILIALAAKKPEEEVVTAFNSYSADEIVSDVLPSSEDTGFISDIKSRISSAKKPTPGEIVKHYGGIFSNMSSPSPVPEASSAPHQPIKTEEKTATSQQMLKNDTDYSISADIFENEALEFAKNAEVLIIHTHTTECYTPEEPGGLPDNGRSTDENKNMIAVGKVIKEELEKAGISVIHDTTFHDYPSYQGAYGRSLTTAQKHLSHNSNIQLILDIHRDAVVNSNGDRVKLIKDTNGVSCAQMMIVCGTDDGGLSHPQWRDNLNFAFKLQKSMNTEYPGLMRPVNLRKERFNQHLTPGSLILEIGTHGNSLPEAKNGAVLIAKEIGKILKNV
ncbi:MAG: stage II sporulation protein P [Clostridia bacterium]|nr:stage II sporulation protein P [Clostridia bacterium]